MGHFRVVGVAAQFVAVLRALAEVALLIDGVNQGSTTSLSHVVVVVCRHHVEERGTEAVQHAAEIVALAIGAQHFSQVARGHQDVFQLMNVTVLAGHVVVDDFVAEDVGRVLRVAVRHSRDDLEVAVGAACRDVVADHLLSSEVHEHGLCGVHHQVDALVIEFLPVDIVLRHSGGSIDVGDGVYDVEARRVFQHDTLLQFTGDGGIGKHFHEDGIVEH